MDFQMHRKKILLISLLISKKISLKDFNDHATKQAYDYLKENNYPFKEKIEL